MLGEILDACQRFFEILFCSRITLFALLNGGRITNVRRYLSSSFAALHRREEAIACREMVKRASPTLEGGVMTTPDALSALN
jgi:hypothetical protein